MARDHLHPTARKMLDLPQDERIRALQVDRWIDYPRATEALRRLRRLLETPERERMPCMVLHGPSNIGKTLIMRKFLRSNPPSFDATRGVEQRTVIAMQMPPTPDQRRFYRALLSVIGAPQGSNSTLASLEQVTCDVLRRMQPRMLIVDEVHHLLAGSHREQRASLNLLKYLANELKISIVAMGTNDAPVAFHTDAQICSRFTPFELPRWTESEDFRRLLSGFEALLPLNRASQLTQREIVQYLLAASDGLLGDVSRMLSDAAELAILDGSEAITLMHLETVAHANV
ncbi:TniB family NTP-binding protein [Verminephrobacter eiseniae]|uniref:TniB family NTP-binding protein n=1 Tax=Verminephrobacter eiseniae TaxID=364317 RepID=UPI0022390CFB|nr:TniB family NTP-binding protein [Verminephrobacter eiseniae]MCW5232328.1 transposase [Verminephrobacter eiseniae]MCW5296108.1 transposase [Verminephrobacter eiseniae]MCW8186938.1 transposase [Verminephrobacter eiseniae]MCW8225324.1 transposase [Verminephrobacter eiseniae]MCW8236348.1 transposase [Verminephrobacter eiseniae]